MEKRLFWTKKKVIALIICIALVVAFAVWFFIINKPETDETTTSTGNFSDFSEQYVAMPVKDLQFSDMANIDGYLTGVIEPKSVSKFNVDASKGKVTEVHVKVGDNVKAGDKLFTYSNPEGVLTLKEDELNLSSQKALITQKETELTQLNTSIKNAISPEEKATLQEQKSTKTLELEREKINLERAKIALEASQSKFGNNTIVASTDGIVQKIDDAQVNKSASTGEQAGTFVEVMDTTSFIVKGKVDEFRHDGIKVDQSVMIINRNDESLTWPGKVTKVSSLPEGSEGTDQGSMDSSMMMGGGMENPGLSKYPFTVEIPAAEGVVVGRHVFISFNAPAQATDTSVIKLPNEFLVAKEDKHYVWLAKDEKATLVEVEIGESVEMQTVIVSGITLEDNIVFPDPSLKEGTKVQVIDSSFKNGMEVDQVAPIK